MVVFYKLFQVTLCQWGFLRVTRVAKRVFVGERFTSWKMNSMNHNNSCKLVDFHQTCPLLELQKLESEIPFIVRWSRRGNFVNHVSIFLLSTVKRFIHHADIGASKIPSVVASVSSLAQLPFLNLKLAELLPFPLDKSQSKILMRR